MTASHIGQRKESHPKREHVFSHTNTQQPTPLNLWKKHSHLFLISSEQGTQEWQVGTGAASHFWRMFSKERSLLKLPCKQPSVGVLIFPSFLVWRDRTPHPGPFIYGNFNRNSCLFASVLIEAFQLQAKKTLHISQEHLSLSITIGLNIPGAVFQSVSFIFLVLTIIPYSKSNMTEIMYKKRNSSTKYAFMLYLLCVIELHRAQKERLLKYNALRQRLI